MTVLDKLASALQRRDEVPNTELAKLVAGKNDRNAVKELVENLNNKSKAIQSGCIKVLYEIGEIKPELISKYTKEFVALLDSKNNRLQWGAMTALHTITHENPEGVYASLAKIVAAADSGSVITKDHAVNILITLCSVKQYAGHAFPLLMEQLLHSPVNQLPMYAERASPVINDKNKKDFIRILSSRLNDFEKEIQRKRVEKVLKKFS
jgi:hypothetical protein